MSQFEDNVQTTRARIDAAARISGREPESVKLIAVSKYLDAEGTAELVAAGCLCLGENRPQVLWEKAAALSSLDIEWHLIGNLQRNKIKRTLPLASLIHSVDSIRLMNALNTAAQERDKPISVLLEINISGESAKHGFDRTQLESALEHAVTCPAIHVKGLMCMAGLTGDVSAAQREFSALRELRDKHRSFQTDNVRLHELSMGMSGDFEAAIAEGATMVRIGSLLTS